MEPRTTTPTPSPETGNYPKPEVPQVNEGALKSVPEQQPKMESREQQPGIAGPSDPVAAIVTPQPLHLPAPIAPAQPPPHVMANDNPLQASDEDLIEKEWVDKAKKIVESTKSDPYQQEKQVSQLQADYINKRYGKTVKITND